MKQRQLTQEELNLAPEWATRFLIRPEYANVVMFANDENIQLLYKCGELGVVHVIGSYANNQFEWQPIPRKVFDLSSVQWSDKTVFRVSIVDGLLVTEIEEDFSGNFDIFHYTETKQDIINKAKALGVTAEDFK